MQTDTSLLQGMDSHAGAWEPEKMRVPKLRFPEFRGKGEWEEKKLGSCLSRHPEYGINAAAVPYTKDLPTYMRITDISEDGNFLRNKKVSVAKEVNKENYLSEGDIVLARTGASVGKSYKYKKEDGELVFAGFLIRVRPDKGKLNSELLFQFLSTEQYWCWVDFSSARSGQPGINGNEYASLPITLPPTLKEQQKIADCLSSLDELITAHSQKHAALKAHKKGLMQQLFPATGKTVPKLRFPEFRDAGEWEDTKLGDLSIILRGGSPRPIDNYMTIEASGLNWLKIADVNKDAKYVTCTKERVLVTALSKTREVNPGDLIMSNSMSFGRPYILKIKTCIHDGWIAVTEIDKQANRDYLYYLILSPVSQAYFVNNAAGSGVQNLNADIIKLLPVLIPKDPTEQQKIADCLSSIDDLITAQAKKIDALKAHKKGLMQQLFPATDEVDA